MATFHHKNSYDKHVHLFHVAETQWGQTIYEVEYDNSLGKFEKYEDISEFNDSHANSLCSKFGN